MTKVDPLKLREDLSEVDRRNMTTHFATPRHTTLQNRVTKWPPGATVTIAELNVFLSVLHFSLVSLARFLLHRQPPSELYSKISPQLTTLVLISLLRGCAVQRNKW